MNSLFEEPLYKCDVCENEFPRNSVVKIGRGGENYTACRKCFMELLGK